MNKKTLLAIPAAALAAVTVGALLWSNTAGAKPSEPALTLPDSASGDVLDGASADTQAWGAAVDAAIAALDAKKNEDNLVVRVDEERIDPDATGRVSYCYNNLLPANADYPEPALTNQPGTEVCDGAGTTPLPDGAVVKSVTVDPTPRSEGGPAALDFQTAHLDGDGVVIRVFDRDGNIITNPVVVTLTAKYSYPAAVPAG